MNAQRELPTLKQEIDRKSFETIDWLATAFDHGKLTNAQYATGLEALFMAVAGLADDDVVGLISTASGIAGVSASVEKRNFINGARVVALSWIGDQESYHMAIYEDGLTKVSTHKNFGTPKEARAKFGAASSRLLEIGYHEL